MSYEPSPECTTYHAPRTTKTTGGSSSNELDVGEVFTEKKITENDLKDVPSMLAALGNENLHGETYFAIGCVLKNEGYEFEEFDKWCKMYNESKYNESTARSFFDSLETRKEKCFTQHTLRSLLKRKFPNEHNDRVLASWMNKIVDQVSKPTIDFAEYGYDVSSYNERYCKSLTQEFRTYDDIQLHSHLGTGKTTVICDLIRDGNYSSIVCITPRVAFAHSMHASLKKVEDRFVLYKDIPKADRHKERFVVCQMESIHTLGNSFDLVIFDESESNLAQLNSKGTIVDFYTTADKLENLMRDARKTIWSDAFVLDRSLVACARIRPNTKKLYIQNTHQPYDRQAFRVARNGSDFGKFVKTFQSENQGKRIVIATGSRENSDQIHYELKDVCKVLKINSYTSDSLIRSLSDVNAVWSQYDVVVYTTSITVGISYDDAENPFDYLFLHFSCCSSTVRDLFQSSLRARTITTNTMYYSHFSHYDTGECSREFDRDRLRDIIKKRNKKETIQLKPWMLDLWAFTNQERNTNAYLHEDVINAYLKVCGYTAQDLVPTQKQIRELRAEEIKAGYENDYLKIQSLTPEEYSEVELLIKKGQADTCHKQQRKKYVFDNDLVSNDMVDLEVRAEMFKTYVRESSKIEETQKNISAEISFSINGEINTPSIYVNNLKEKVERISALTKLLGVEFSYETATVPHESIVATCDYIQLNIAALKKEWGLNLRCHVVNEKGTLKKSLGVLNQILGKWGFQEVVRGEQKRKRCKKNCVDVSDFELRTRKKYTQFDKYCLQKSNWELHKDLFVADDIDERSVETEPESPVVKRNEYVENVITKLRTEYARLVEERKSYVERCVTDLKEEMDALSEFNKEKVSEFKKEKVSEFKKEDFDVTSCLLDRYICHMRVLDAEENQFWN